MITEDPLWVNWYVNDMIYNFMSMIRYRYQDILDCRNVPISCPYGRAIGVFFVIIDGEVAMRYSECIVYTVGCRYDVVYYIIIFYIILKWLVQKMNQSLYSQNTRASYGLSIVRFFDWPRCNSTASI